MKDLCTKRETKKMDKVIEILEVMVKSSNTSGSELEYVLYEIKKEIRFYTLKYVSLK